MSSGIVETGRKQEQEAANAAGVSRSRLVQRLLSASSNLPAFITDLLTTQAVVVAGTEAAGFIVEQKDGEAALRPIAHIRPDNSNAETRAAAIAAFQDLLRPCIVQNKDGALEVGAAEPGAEPQFCLVTILRSEGNAVAVSAVITRCRDLERAQQRLMSMQLVAGYFELYQVRRASEQSQLVAQSHQHVLQLASAVATAEGFQAAANNLCNELALRTGASRVAVGWMKGRNVKVKALSHTEQFDKKQELIVQIEKAMEECIDQEEMVQYDPEGPGTDNVTRDAQALARSQGGNTVLSLPLRRNAEIVGVITLEFAPAHKLGPQAATGLAVAVDLLAPQLYDRFQNDRYLITKTGLSIRDSAKMVVGPKHMLAKLVVMTIIGLALFVTFYKPMYRVAGKFEFVPVERRSISAPFEAIIGELGKVNGEILRPGMQVKKGDFLLKLDTHDLEIKALTVRAEANSHYQEAIKYRGEGKISEAQVAQSKQKRAELEAKGIEDQIKLATITAPIDGKILQGDLTYRRGQKVSPNDVLLEIGQVEGMLVEMTVSERDIKDVQPGMQGRLSTTSLPQEKHPFKVKRVVPLGTPKEGDNTFAVYGELTETQPKDWLPGMQGEARIDVEEKRLAWIWTHRLVEFVRLKLWI